MNGNRDLLREFTRDTISSEPLDNETESGDEINTETIPLPNSEMNYDDVMKMLHSLADTIRGIIISG